MTDPTPLRPADSIQRKLLADEALELLENHAFTSAVLALRKRWFAEMLSTDPKYLVTIQARLQTLEAIAQQLQSFVNDQKMHEARKK